MIPLPPTDEEPRPRLRWKHGSVPVVGLIGGIGAGKSAAARLLADRGAAIIDADAVGHELLEDPAIRGRILERFGAGVLEPESGASPAGNSTGQGPRISRRALGAVVFAEAPALRDLESILHPAMRDRFRRVIEHVARDGRSPCVVLDAAVLLEAGWDDLCDLVIFVDAPRPDRLRRVAQSRGWSESTLDARERSQWPSVRKRRRTDWDHQQRRRPGSAGPGARPDPGPAAGSGGAARGADHGPRPGRARPGRAGAGLARHSGEDLVTPQRSGSGPARTPGHPPNRSPDGRPHRDESPAPSREAGPYPYRPAALARSTVPRNS